MPHLFRGFSGVVTAVTVPVVIWMISYTSRKKHATYNMNPKDKPGEFEPLLQKYLRLAEFMIGLSTGSVVLLVGSSVVHGQEARLPWFYASPLLILAGSAITGVAFMAWLILCYEEVQHGNSYTSKAYSLSETFGFSSLALFLIGYVWLIIAVTY